MDFAATFISHDLEWLREWEALQQQDVPDLKVNGTLMEVVQKRLRWEVAAEFGYRSRLGSSVEQAGSLTAAVDPAAITALLPELLSRLQNEIEPLRQIRTSQVQQLVSGLLHHWRQRGGFDLPELLGEANKGSAYLSSGGTDTFVLNTRILHTPRFGPSAPKPNYITSYRGKGNFEQLVREKGPITWPQHWLERTLQPSKTLDSEQQKEALQAVIDALLGAGLLIEIPGERAARIWAIPRSRIQVSAEPTLMRCSCCGDGQAIPADQLPLWDGMPCLVRHCAGSYSTDQRG